MDIDYYVGFYVQVGNATFSMTGILEHRKDDDTGIETFVVRHSAHIWVEFKRDDVMDVLSRCGGSGEAYIVLW